MMAENPDLNNPIPENPEGGLVNRPGHGTPPNVGQNHMGMADANLILESLQNLRQDLFEEMESHRRDVRDEIDNLTALVRSRDDDIQFILERNEQVDVSVRDQNFNMNANGPVSYTQEMQSLIDRQNASYPRSPQYMSYDNGDNPRYHDDPNTDYQMPVNSSSTPNLDQNPGAYGDNYRRHDPDTSYQLPGHSSSTPNLDQNPGAYGDNYRRQNNHAWPSNPDP